MSEDEYKTAVAFLCFAGCGILGLTAWVVTL